jgi:histone acetyltransferase (RNA polymerase elongator complex component)
MCSFCNQHTISGAQTLPHAKDVKEVCEKALREVKEPENTEIAFFGGSFTAVPADYRRELLQAAADYVGREKFAGIRISTRPDCIDEDILRELKSYRVTAIELGAQSLSDEVLIANERGHSAEAVVRASELIKDFGFELGLQMMTGLYKSSRERDLETFEKILSLRPATLRIYPVVILKGTRLAELYEAGKYCPPAFEEMTELCGDLLYKAHRAGVRVIKCGLHASEFVEKDRVGGYYHPAFRELCENRIYRKLTDQLLRENNIERGRIEICVSPGAVSKAAGQKRSNTEYFEKMGIRIKFKPCRDVGLYELRLSEVNKCI